MADGQPDLATYVVRITRDVSRGISGVVVRVATGERFVFESVDQMAALLRERVTTDLSERE